MFHGDIPNGVIQNWRCEYHDDKPNERHWSVADPRNGQISTQCICGGRFWWYSSDISKLYNFKMKKPKHF